MCLCVELLLESVAFLYVGLCREWEFVVVVVVLCLLATTVVTFSGLILAERGYRGSVVRLLASGHHLLQLLTQWCCYFLLRLWHGTEHLAAVAPQFAALHCAGQLGLVTLP